MFSAPYRALGALLLGGLSAFAQQSLPLHTFDLLPATFKTNAPTVTYGGNGSWTPNGATKRITYEGLTLSASDTPNDDANTNGALTLTFPAALDLTGYDRIELTAAKIEAHEVGRFNLELASGSGTTLRRTVHYASSDNLTRHGDKVIFRLAAPDNWNRDASPVNLGAVVSARLSLDWKANPTPARLILRELKAANDTLLDPAHFATDRILGYNSWFASRTPQSGRIVIGSPAVALNNASLYFRYVNASPSVADERDLTPYTSFTVTAVTLPGNEADLRLELRSVGGGASHWILPSAAFASESTVTFDLRAPANPASPTPVNLSRLSGISLSALGNSSALDVRWSLGAVRLTPALPAVYTFRRGLNISHWLAQLNTRYPLFADPDRFNAGHLDHIDSLTRGPGGPRAFDHIRIPVDYAQAGDLDTSTTPPSYALRPTFVSAFSEILLQARARDLGVILDLHTLPGLAMGEDIAHPLFAGGTSPAKTAAAYQAEAAIVWRSFARHFANEGPWLRFELMNEPRYARRLTTGPNAGQNSYEPMHSRAVAEVQEGLRRVIRESNPKRTIYVTTNNLGSLFQFFGAQKTQPGYTAWGVFATSPSDTPYYGWDPHLAYTIHYYEPFDLTHFYLGDTAFTTAALVAALSETGSIHTQFNQLRADLTNLDPTNNYLREYREIHIGEFGITHLAGEDHAWRYAAENPQRIQGFDSVREHFMFRVRQKAEEHGFGWCAWDYLADDYSVFNANGAADPAANSAGRALLRP